MQENTSRVGSTFKRHAYAVMPYGLLCDREGALYDFDAIYSELLRPACELTGFELFRRDGNTATDEALTDLFQEFLLADLVICDLSIHDANTFYEIGVCHALRKQGILHIQAGRALTPFDIFNLRALPYHVTDAGLPHPDFLAKDIQALSRLIQSVWKSQATEVHSPIFNLLSALKEPEQNQLCTPLATGYWREYNEFMEQVVMAKRGRQKNQIEFVQQEATDLITDVVSRVEGFSKNAVREYAMLEAGKMLSDLGLHEQALALFQNGLETLPDHPVFQRRKAFHLLKLGRVDEAIVTLEKMLMAHPGQAETLNLLGDIYMDMWVQDWNDIQDSHRRLRMAFDSYHWLLKAYSIFRKAITNENFLFYSAGTALLLGTILIRLADQFDDPADPEPEIAWVRKELPLLKAAIEFAHANEVYNERSDFWTLISKAELRLLENGEGTHVLRAYRKAMAVSRRNVSLLNQSMRRIVILQQLGICVELAQVGLEVIREEMNRIT